MYYLVKPVTYFYWNFNTPIEFKLFRKKNQYSFPRLSYSLILSGTLLKASDQWMIFKKLLKCWITWIRVSNLHYRINNFRIGRLGGDSLQIISEVQIFINSKAYRVFRATFQMESTFWNGVIILNIFKNRCFNCFRIH